MHEEIRMRLRQAARLVQHTTLAVRLSIHLPKHWTQSECFAIRVTIQLPERGSKYFTVDSAIQLPELCSNLRAVPCADVGAV